MKTVGFYGHSNCAYRDETSHIDLLSQHLNYQVVNVGVRQGSEERILYELKKTKNLDLAIIFHSEPQYLFLPGCDRDIGLNHLREHRAEYLFEHWNSDFYLQHHGKFLEKFKTVENFMRTIETYKSYFYTPDLQMNRFLGALVQIDQYCLAKNISVIHIVDSNIPSWFKFSSGISDTSVMTIIANNQGGGGKYVNGMSEIGNRLVYERLTELVEKVTSPSPAGLV